MKNIIVSLLIILAIFGGLIFVASNQSNSKKINQLEISLEQINKNQKNGSIIVDVRTAKEFDINHAVSAINLPVEDIKKGKLPTTAKDKIIYVYCRTGKRATDAKKYLDSIGYTKVINLTSLRNWIALGGKSVSSAGKQCMVANETAC